MKGILENVTPQTQRRTEIDVSWAIRKPNGAFVRSGWKNPGTRYIMKSLRYNTLYRHLAEQTAKDCGGNVVKVTITAEDQ